MRGVSNEHRRKNFSRSLVLVSSDSQQFCVPIKRPLRERATELGVLLVIGDESDGAIDTPFGMGSSIRYWND
jgi:hypothetical protein